MEINAKKAREHADAINLERQQNQLFKLGEAIGTAMNGGEYYVFFYETILPENLIELKKQGFVVEQNKAARQGEIEYKISW